jgi:hypothetical protein
VGVGRGGTAPEQINKQQRCAVRVGKVLEIVEHEQQGRRVCQRLDDLIHRGHARLPVPPQRVQNGVGDPGRVGDLGERREEHAIVKKRGEPSGRLDRQPGFAAPPQPGQGQQAGGRRRFGGKKPDADCFYLGLASKKARELQRQARRRQRRRGRREQWRGSGGKDGWRHGRQHCRRRHGIFFDLLGQSAHGGTRCVTAFLFQNTLQRFVLAQGGVGLTRGGEQTHQIGVRFVVERIGDDCPARAIERRAPIARTLAVRGKAAQRFPVRLRQPCSLIISPGGIKTGQKRTVVQKHRFFEKRDLFVWRAVGTATFVERTVEFSDVHADRGRVQGDVRASLGDQDGPSGHVRRLQLPPQRGKRNAQVRARHFARLLGPEQTGEFVAGMAALAVQRKIGQQGCDFFRTKAADDALAVRAAQPAQKFDTPRRVHHY